MTEELAPHKTLWTVTPLRQGDFADVMSSDIGVARWTDLLVRTVLFRPYGSDRLYGAATGLLWWVHQHGQFSDEVAKSELEDGLIGVGKEPCSRIFGRARSFFLPFFPQAACSALFTPCLSPSALIEGLRSGASMAPEILDGPTSMMRQILTKLVLASPLFHVGAWPDILTGVGR